MRFCALGSIRDFVGYLAVFGSLLLLTCGSGDTRYVAKKFAAYHFIALILCAWADILPKDWNNFPRATILQTVAFGVLTAAYPLNGWLDSFFIRGSNFFLDTWLIVIRPTVIGFFSATVGNAVVSRVGGSATAVSMALAWSSLGFVPILFFAKTEIRRLIARMACWQSGYIWLFALYFSPKDSHLLTLLAVTQGIFLAIISQSATSLCGEGDGDFVEKMAGAFERDYFSAVFAASSLVFLLSMPVIFLLKQDMDQLQLTLILQVIGSTVLPSLFSLKVYRSMKKSAE
jgi:hypothetical protein